MEVTYDIKQRYASIQNKIYNMIPEKWEKLCLYVSVIENASKMRTGEMYFYYFPKSIIKRPPVNLYEIASKFNLDEVAYEEMIQNLYTEFENLRDDFIRKKERPWTNLTMVIEYSNLDMFYDYEDLTSSNYTDEERHVIWLYKYVNDNMDTYGKKERQIIKKYLNLI